MNDVDDDPALVLIAPLSHNAALVPPGGLVVTGEGPLRRLAIRPAPGQTGEARIGLQAADPHGATASTSFRVTVTPAPPRTPPRITGIAFLAGGRVRLRVAAEAGLALHLESSPALGVDADWRSEAATATSSGAEVELESDPSPIQVRFYRIRTH